jgi:hypothetical protein
MEKWENKKQEGQEEALHAPENGWEEITERMLNIEMKAFSIDDGVSILPKTNDRRVAWEGVARKIIELRDAIRDNRELGTEPDQELFESLEEVENEIKKFTV